MNQLIHLRASPPSQRAVTLWGWKDDALAMCHRLCGLSTYGLKAHVREMSTPPKLTITHGPPLPLLFNQLIDLLVSG